MKFRNIKGTFEFYENGEMTVEQILDEDEILYENRRYESYIDPESGNIIVFDQIRFEGEEWLDDTTDIANCISREAYDYICNVLNTYRNTTVYWSQVYGTTSDYFVLPNMMLPDYDNLTQFIYNAKHVGSYKYMILKDNGEFHHIKEA